MNVKQDLIPIGKLRPAVKMDWTTITIHNTGNEKSTAQNERDWLVNPTNTRIASYHYVIYQDQIIQVIPDDERAYHCADRVGNATSLGIEICEAGMFNQSMITAVEFIAMKLHSKGLGVQAIRKHQDWNDKYCPRLLIPIWDSFISMIQHELDRLNMKKDHWAEKSFQSLLSKGIVIHQKRFDDPITRGEMFALMDKIVK